MNVWDAVDQCAFATSFLESLPLLLLLSSVLNMYFLAYSLDTFSAISLILCCFIIFIGDYNELNL